MSAESAARGRLFLVTGADPERAAATARALGGRLPRCVVVEGPVVAAMVVSRDSEGTGPLHRIERLLLRWSACLAMAETYLLEGYDAVVADAVSETVASAVSHDHLEDFLDLAAPEPVHLVVVDDARSSAIPLWGLWLAPDQAPDALAGQVLERLDEAVVVTAEAAPPRESGEPG